MSLIQSAVVEALRGAIRIFTSLMSARDRRTVVLERRAKALSLFKELAAVGLRPRDLKMIDRTLTEEEDERRSPRHNHGDA